MEKLEELRRQREEVNSRIKNDLINMKILADDSLRVAEVAHNSETILDNLDKEFEKQTGLQGPDIKFLFIATGLQCLRIYLLDKLTKREKATKIKKEDGSYTLEGKIDKSEQKLLNKFDKNIDIDEETRLYYAPLNQIIANPKVPYDCTSGGGQGFFQNANHRFSTLGHDPVLGLFFGTANILTNTISTTRTPIPGIFTNHVLYETTQKKDGKLKIAKPIIDGTNILSCSTIEMCNKVRDRFENDKLSVVAALIKQILHIGTDMYTKLGIQLPGASLILNSKQVENISKYTDWGTTVKSGISGLFSLAINNIISLLHNFMYSNEMGISHDIYNIRTKKIIAYSNFIASCSNIISTGIKMVNGNGLAIKDLDIGGIIVTVHKLTENHQYIRKIKEEYIFGNFNKMIEGEELKLFEI